MTSKRLAAGLIIIGLVMVAAAGVLVWYQTPTATTTSSDFNDVDGLLQDLDSLVDLENQYSLSDMSDVAAD